MQISTYRLPQDVPVRFCMNKTAVVIDVLRATTTIIAALYHGCNSVIPVSEVEEAIEISRNFPADERVLAGERECLTIDGFDLSNSPVEFSEERVRDKTVFLTTTNGTRAIQSAQAEQVLVAGLVNRTVTAKYLAEQGRDTAIICAGTMGHFSMEDHLAAGAIIHALQEAGADVELNDLSLASLILYKQYDTADKMHELLGKTQHYQRLKELGQVADLDLCLTQDCMPLLARCSDGTVSQINKQP